MSDAEAQTVTKKELVNRISEETGHTKVVVKEILQRFLDEIVEELAQGHRLEFREFGVFEVKLRASRTAQNPRTLEKVKVPSKRVVKFKVGRLMRERIGDEPEPVPPPKARAATSAPAAKPAPTPAPKPPPSNSPF